MMFKSTQTLPSHLAPNRPKLVRRLASVLANLTMISGLFLAPSARAAIAIQEAPLPIQYNGGGGATINSASYTVSSGASVLVVFFSTRNSGSANPGNPSNMQWNGHPLTLAVSANTTASTFDYNLI